MPDMQILHQLQQHHIQIQQQQQQQQQQSTQQQHANAQQLPPNTLNDATVQDPLYNFTDVYLITKYMDTNLRAIIKSEQVLSPKHVEYIMYQILLGVRYMHSANILHRDLVRCFFLF